MHDPGQPVGWGRQGGTEHLRVLQYCHCVLNRCFASSHSEHSPIIRWSVLAQSHRACTGLSLALLSRDPCLAPTVGLPCEAINLLRKHNPAPVGQGGDVDQHRRQQKGLSGRERGWLTGLRNTYLYSGGVVYSNLTAWSCHASKTLASEWLVGLQPYKREDVRIRPWSPPPFPALSK
jgi:hypothetical protein